MTPFERHAFIRTVERMGGEFRFYVGTNTNRFEIEVLHQGWRYSAVSTGRFNWEAVRDAWEQHLSRLKKATLQPVSISPVSAPTGTIRDRLRARYREEGVA